MKFGLNYINAGACAYPATMAHIASTAEAVGFDSLWVVEHVVLPDPHTPASGNIPPEIRILDPIVALSYLAALTRHILLGTGIIILPQRNPLVLAKALASLDTLADGRLMFGIGVGWLEAEFEALGIPFTERGVRTEEYLTAIQTIWSEQHPAYQGRFVSFANIQAHPQPQRMVPIVVGGRSPAVYRRAAERANGWYGHGLDLDGTAQAIVELNLAAQRYHRPAVLGELEISSTPVRPLTRDLVKQYADIGVHRLILRLPYDTDEMTIHDFVSTTAEMLMS